MLAALIIIWLFFQWATIDQYHPYGLFLGELLNFVIVAAAVFLFLVKFLGWIIRSKKEEEVKPPTRDQELLTEIRDLLKEQAGRKTTV